MNQPDRHPARRHPGGDGGGRYPSGGGRYPSDDGGRRSEHRRREGLGGEQVEGRQAVRELLRAGTRRVHQVLVAEGAGRAESLDEIRRLAAAAGIAVRRVDRGALDATAGTDAPQGVIAFAEPVPEADIEALVTRHPGGPAPFLVVLDGVSDPHNLGAVMRSAVAAGATGLVIGRHRSASLTPAAVKAAAGAVEHLPVASVAGIPAALSVFADRGVWTVGLDGSAPETLWGLQVATEPVALVLGAEGRGLSRLARTRCDVVVAIPLQGPIDSLNVSAAAALACFEVARRRSSDGRPG